MKYLAKIGFTLLTLSLLFACKKDKNFPKTPVIEHRDFIKYSDKQADWKIGFTDGDGDFGVRNDNDSTNFLVSVFAIKDNIAEKIEPAVGYRVPAISGVRTENGVEGEFILHIEPDLYRILNLDSIYFTGYVLDRTGNSSNTIQTPTFTTD